ncbi:MAG: ABC transporter permease [Actinomycetota bacterium]
MRDVLLVAAREFRAQVRTKGFVIGLVISAAVVAVVVILPQLLGSGNSYNVGLVGDDSQALAPTLAQVAEGSGAEVTTSTIRSEDAARTAIEEGDADAAIVDGSTVLTDGQLEPQFEAVLQSAHRAVATEQELVSAGLAPQEAQDVLQVAPLETRSVTGDAQYEGSRQALAFLTVLVLFFLIVGAATLVAMGVVEEKGSRIVEILLVAVHPWRLLAGKIIAFAGLGLIQLVVFASAGFGAAVVAGSLPQLPPGTPGVFASAFVGFLLGFVFYAAVAAALASLVSRQEDVGQVTGPMTMAIVASYLVGIWALNNPDAVVGHILSMVPPFAAMVMPVRVATTEVPLWEIGVAAGGMLLGVAAVLTAGGRIYERAVLRTGVRVKLSEAWRGSQVARGITQ